MSEEERAVRDFVAEWMDASIAGDTERVLRLVADDVVFLRPSQQPMRKSEFAALQAAMSNVRLEGTAQVQDARVAGDLAYVWTQIDVAITPRAGGATVNRSGPALSVLVKRDGRWTILRDANMTVVV
jgi:uncharacterized protein (TIGR02246 family)